MQVAKFIKFLIEKIEENLFDTGLINDFWYMTSKYRQQKQASENTSIKKQKKYEQQITDGRKCLKTVCMIMG